MVKSTTEEISVLRILSVLLLILAGAWGAQASELTDAIQKRYDTLQSFRGFFVQTLINASSRETQERLGTIVFVRPQNIARAYIQRIEDHIDTHFFNKSHIILMTHLGYNVIYSVLFCAQ